MSASKRAKIDDDFEPNQEEEDFSGSIDSTVMAQMNYSLITCIE